MTTPLLNSSRGRRRSAVLLLLLSLMRFHLLMERRASLEVTMGEVAAPLGLVLPLLGGAQVHIQEPPVVADRMALLTTSESSMLAKSATAGHRKGAEMSILSLGSPSSPYPLLRSPCPPHVPLPFPGLPQGTLTIIDSRLLGNVSGRACAGDTMKAGDQVGWEGNKGSAPAAGTTARRPLH